MVAGVLLRPNIVLPAAQRLQYAGRQWMQQSSRQNNHGDSFIRFGAPHFGATTRQHRIINGVASLLFLAGAVFWGISETHAGHELISAEMAAPGFTGAGSLLTLANAIIPVDRWGRRKAPKPAGKHRKDDNQDA